MADSRDAARGHLARLVELDSFAARGMVRGWHLGCEYIHFWMQAVESENLVSREVGNDDGRRGARWPIQGMLRPDTLLVWSSSTGLLRAAWSGGGIYGAIVSCHVRRHLRDLKANIHRKQDDRGICFQRLIFAFKRCDELRNDVIWDIS